MAAKDEKKDLNKKLEILTQHFKSMYVDEKNSHIHLGLIVKHM